jgi:hypothetical protein
MGVTVSHSLDLVEVRRRLDRMVEWRLAAPFAPDQERRYQELMELERLLIEGGGRVG